MPSLYYDPFVLRHDTGEHPERAGRILPALERIENDPDLSRWRKPKWEPLTNEQLARVHDLNYVKTAEDFAARGGGHLDADTVVVRDSFRAAALAAGAAVAAVDEVLTTQSNTAFCLVRPPGHHAVVERAMGFCLFNNVALAARHAIEHHKLRSVVVIDWDVHHGNGTQDIFWTSGEVGFFSIHRSPFYPGTGAADETGAGAGLGATLNKPIRYGTSREQFIAEFRAGVETLCDGLRPELILISAGFDAHRLDPIGSLGLEAEDYQQLTRIVRDVANIHSAGRIVSVLEGGYHAQAVADSLVEHLRALNAAA